MKVTLVRCLLLLVGVLAGAGIAQQLVASRAARSKLESEKERQDGLEARFALANQRLDVRWSALQQFAEGQVDLEEAARQFRAADAWDEASMDRVRRLWPDAPSDDERYAAEVVRCLRERVQLRPTELAALVRAESDYWQAFGRSPDPVG